MSGIKFSGGSNGRESNKSCTSSGSVRVSWGLMLNEWLCLLRKAWVTLCLATLMGAAASLIVSHLMAVTWSSRILVRYPEQAPQWVLNRIDSVDVSELGAALSNERRTQTAPGPEGTPTCRISVQGEVAVLPCSGQEDLIEMTRKLEKGYMLALRQSMTIDNQSRRDKLLAIERFLAGDESLAVFVQPESRLFLGPQISGSLVKFAANPKSLGEVLQGIKTSISENLKLTELAASHISLKVEFEADAPNHMLFAIDGALLGLFLGWLVAWFRGEADVPKIRVESVRK